MMPRCRTWLGVAAGVLLLASCGGGSAGDLDAASSESVPVTAAPTPSRTPRPIPLQLTAEKAAEALAEVAVPAGFRVDIRCPPRSAQDKKVCGPPTDADTTWSASLTYLGTELPRANELPATLVINLVTARTERSAVALYRQQAAALRSHTGTYDIPPKKRAGSYTPGQRGRGTVTRREVGDWQGVNLSDRFVLVFDGSTSDAVMAGTHVASRGVHVLNISWSTGDTQLCSSLAELPDRMAAALDQVG